MPNQFLEEVKQFLSDMWPRPSQPIICHVSYFLKLCPKKLKDYSMGFGGTQDLLKVMGFDGCRGMV